MVSIPPAAVIALGVNIWGLYSFFVPFIDDIKPYFSLWMLFMALTMSATRGLIRCADCRFSHSACLLPLLLAKDELQRCECEAQI